MVIFTVEAACSYASCDRVVQQSWIKPRSRTDSARWLRSMGWSTRSATPPKIGIVARCPKHRGAREVNPGSRMGRPVRL